MSERPTTSKPRGTCHYFRSSRGCRNGDACKFLHGDNETLSPYDKSKTCKFYVAGFCKRGDKCWFRHINSTSGESSIELVLSTNTGTSTELDNEDEPTICSICQEKPVTYGLLEDCSHVFCLECIRGWRDPSGKTQDIVISGNTKRCPYCRKSSKFVTPSSVFYPDGDPLKATTIANYMASMSRIPCKYFERSLPGSRFCPFGKDCFYQHKELDGTDFVFERGADYYMSKRGRLRDRRADATFVDLLASLQRRRMDLDLLQAATALRPDLRAHIESVFSRIRRNLRNIGQNLSDTLRSDIIEHLESFDALTMSSGDDHVEEAQVPSSRPSILATPEDSAPTSALPLTRAFMDRNISSEIVDSLTDVEESENGEYDSHETPIGSLSTQSRRHSLPDLANLLNWTGESDVSVQMVRDSEVMRFADSEQQALGESGHSNIDERQEGTVSSGSALSDDTAAPEAYLSSAFSAQHLISNEPVIIQEANLNDERPSLPADASPSDDDSRAPGCETRRKPETRSDLTARRAKSSNNITSCNGRRNGGQSFVTDGRGRVVATDDSAHTDSASLAFWSTPDVAPQLDSANETSEQASVGPGPLDDLD
ncbi:hypothetical protein ACEPAG_7324 [Sanghuangporus baumii]